MAGPADDRPLGRSRPGRRSWQCRAEIERAFRDAFLLLDRRISLFLSLPLTTLDRACSKAGTGRNRRITVRHKYSRIPATLSGANMKTAGRLSFLDRYLTALDLRRHGCRSHAGMARSRDRAVPQPLQRRHDFDSDRGRLDRDDVSAVHQGALRRTATKCFATSGYSVSHCCRTGSSVQS